MIWIVIVGLIFILFSLIYTEKALKKNKLEIGQVWEWYDNRNPFDLTHYEYTVKDISGDYILCIVRNLIGNKNYYWENSYKASTFITKDMRKIK